jgi:hypothetical protein
MKYTKTMLEVKKGGAMPWGLYEGTIGYKNMLEVEKGRAMSWGLFEGTIGYSERNDHTTVISQRNPRGSGDD